VLGCVGNRRKRVPQDIGDATERVLRQPPGRGGDPLRVGPVLGVRAGLLGDGARAGAILSDLPEGAGQVEERAAELALRAAQDPELARKATASLRIELGPPRLPWAAALEVERGPQLWSLRRRHRPQD